MSQVYDVLAESDWTARAAAHRTWVDTFTAPHRHRAARGQAHPVWDFLFTYYSLRPRQLRVWHPGFGAVLTGAAAAGYLSRAGYEATDAGVTVGADYLRSRLRAVEFVGDLLRRTAARPPQFGCFGMHEWAMVYRAGDVRHAGVPLRLGSAGTDAVVDSIPLRCSHFDAFRFFTPEAVPLNQNRLSRDRQAQFEQPGCLHANMDLYRHCYKLGPLVESDVLRACLQLAADARELDMRASPYDLSGYGFDSITVEEPAGRAEYVRRQDALARRAAPLRAALLDRCERLLAISAESVAASGQRLPAGRINRLSLREEP